MHSGGLQVASQSLSHRLPSSVESNPNIKPDGISNHMTQLHSPISDIENETENDNDNTPHEYTYDDYNQHSKHKTKSLKTKSKSKNRPKYNTLRKPSAITHQTTNSSSSSNISSNTPSPITHTDHHHISSKTPSTHQFERGYKRWKGQNSIFCNGRIIAGPETKKQIRTLFMILIPMGIYFATTCVILWNEYDMQWTVIICAFIFILCIILFFFVSCIDPGIIPRPEIYEKCVESTDVINYISRDEHKHSEVAKIAISPPWEQQINVGGNIRTLKYCYTCHHFRGPRSFHCANCDVCVERFDHHCPWLGNCIARRNYHFYILFLLSINTMCIWVGCTSLYIIMDICSKYYALQTPSHTFVNLWKYHPWPMITLCLAVLGVLFPMILLTFHCYLIATGQTTNEKAKKAFEFVSPYSRGCLGNIIEICCILANAPNSNVHIHHQPPDICDNEAIVNKRKIVYITSQDTKETISNNLNKTSINGLSEQQKLLAKKHSNMKKEHHIKNGIIEEEEEEEEVQLMDSQNDSSMDNNDPTPSSNEANNDQNMPVHVQRYKSQPQPQPVDVSANAHAHAHTHSIDVDRTQSHYDYNIKRTKPKKPKGIVHENVGSNSSLDDAQHQTQTYTTNLSAPKLKRKRIYTKTARSHSGYTAAYKRHKKKQNRFVMESRSNPSIRPQHSASFYDNARSIQSEQIYYQPNMHAPGTGAGTGTGTGTYTDGMTESGGYHPAYHKYMNGLKRKQQYMQHNSGRDFAFSPLSPVNSKDLNGAAPPQYPSPQHAVTNYNTGTPILSINEDNHTLTSTYSFGNGAVQHSNGHKKHLHYQYKGTNSHNTLFSPDLSSGCLENEYTTSSDYYTAITAPSHAYTYHGHTVMNNTNTNGFGHNEHSEYRRHQDKNSNHRAHSHHHHQQHHHHKKHRAKSNSKQQYDYNVNDILELCTTDIYRNYDSNHAERWMD